MTISKDAASEEPGGQRNVEIHGNAHDQSQIVQIGEVHVSPREPQLNADFIRALDSTEAGKRLARMPLDDAFRALASAPITDSAEVLEVLLWDNEDLAISLLANTRRSKAEQLIAAIASAPAWLKDLPTAVHAINQCERSNRSHLGQAAGSTARATPSKCGTHGYYRKYEHGQIHWTERGDAQATYGEIGERHIAMGGSGSRIGFPLTSEQEAGDSPFGTKGRFQRFESRWNYGEDICERIGLTFGATIYWSHGHGARATWGGIGEYYELQGGTWSWLGFPVTNEVAVESSPRRDGSHTKGWFQRFEGGTVYYSDKTRTVAVRSHIAQHHERDHQGVASRVSGLNRDGRLSAHTALRRPGYDL